MQELWKRVHQFFIPSPSNAYRPHALQHSCLVVFFICTFVVEGFLVANLVARQSSENFLAAVVPGSIIALTNDARGDAHTVSLVENARLDAAAQAKAADMAARGYFAHIGPDGTLPWQWITGAGYSYSYAGENLAVRFTDSKDVVNAWMASPSHRGNILKPAYTHIGVGVATGLYEGKPAIFVVQYFGAPLQASAAVGQLSYIDALLGHMQSNLSNIVQTLRQQVLRLLGDPVDTTTKALAGLSIALVVILCLAFFVHIEIQAGDMLAGGFAVLLLVALCGAANAQLFSSTAATAASIASSNDIGVLQQTLPVVISDQAAASEVLR